MLELRQGWRGELVTSLSRAQLSTVACESSFSLVATRRSMAGSQNAVVRESGLAIIKSCNWFVYDMLNV